MGIFIEVFSGNTTYTSFYMIPPKFQNIVAIIYVFVLYGLGIAFIILPFWQLNILGVLFITHSLVISTSLTHEFIHGSVFRSRELNAFWGAVMTHFNGACYTPWESVATHHLNHHLKHVDVIRFDLAKRINHEMPVWLRQLHCTAEWLYFPLIEFELRWQTIFDPLVTENKKILLGRTIGIAILRTAIFSLLAVASERAILLYFVAYTSFVNLERFADAFQHTYEYVVLGEEFPNLDRVYEQRNTFSNLISVEYPWLNLLFLNFGYHNAHHHIMNCPWYQLPELHAKLYGNSTNNVMPVKQLVINYHRFRISRLFSTQGEVDYSGKLNLEGFTGAVAVSLLTPPPY
jgi:fatty acid desaturase